MATSGGDERAFPVDDSTNPPREALSPVASQRDQRTAFQEERKVLLDK
jgi:hypothetical protein